MVMKIHSASQMKLKNSLVVGNLFSWSQNQIIILEFSIKGKNIEFNDKNKRNLKRLVRQEKKELTIERMKLILNNN